MTKHIIGQAIFQLITLLILLFLGPSLIYEKNPAMLEYGYNFAHCFNLPTVNFDAPLDKQNIYLISGFQTLYTNKDNSTFLNHTECNSTFPGIYNVEDAYHHFLAEEYATTHYSIIFNTFVLSQLFNEICCRILDDSYNTFKRIHTNKMFIFIWIIEVALQVIIVQFGGPFFKICNGVRVYTNNLGLV
jgi:Ca2+ transporting ATPase